VLGEALGRGADGVDVCLCEIPARLDAGLVREPLLQLAVQRRRRGHVRDEAGAEGGFAGLA
jgi:hypothetical protein